MLPKRKHLVGSKNFSHICQRGMRIPSQHFTVFAGQSSLNSLKVAVVASRKVGKAVTRSKLKRVLWHAISSQISENKHPNLGYVFVIKKTLATATYLYLQKEVDEALRRVMNRLNFSN